MFHSLLAFLKEVCPFCMTSMASSSCWFVHFERTKIGANLLIICVCVVGAYVKGSGGELFFIKIYLEINNYNFSCKRQNFNHNGHMEL